MSKLNSAQNIIDLSELHVVELLTEFTVSAHFLFFPLFFFFLNTDASHFSCPNGAMGKNAYP